MSDPVPKGYVLSEDAAAILGVQLRTLYRYRYTVEDFPEPTLVGRTLMWNAAELRAWRDAHPSK